MVGGTQDTQKLGHSPQIRRWGAAADAFTRAGYESRLPVQSPGAHPAVEPLLSARYFGDGKNGCGFRWAAGCETSGDGSLRTPVLRSHRAPALAFLADRAIGQRTNYPGRLVRLSPDTDDAA